MSMASLLAISTPLDQFNPFSKMVQMRDEDGESFFNTIQIGMICDECKKLPTQAEMYACTHCGDRNPPWKSGERQKRLKTIALTVDTAARGLRENAGMITNDYNTVFSPLHVNPLFSRTNRPIHTTISPPSRIYVVVDPDGGGQSRMSVMSGYRLHNDSTKPPNCLVVRRGEGSGGLGRRRRRRGLRVHASALRVLAMEERHPVVLFRTNFIRAVALTARGVVPHETRLKFPHDVLDVVDVKGFVRKCVALFA